MMNKSFILYIPVLHEGYNALFKKHPDVRQLFIFGEEVIGEYEHLIKDIRRLSPELIRASLIGWKRFDSIEILNRETIQKIQEAKIPLMVSDDDLTAELVAKYFSQNPIEKDTIFLRWDKKTSVAPEKVTPDVTVSSEEFDKKMIALARAEGEKAKDWWRRIGAVVVKDGKVIYQKHNEYVPSDQIANDEGDPRSNFKSGIHLESSLALHAEAAIVAWAAKEGISLRGTDIYVETFPCPPCAKQLAYSGIRRLYYRTGYKVLDGERILRSQGVEIIFVEG